MHTRTLGTRSVSALGLGCWAIGGPWHFGDQEAGWGTVDDQESIRAVQAALDLGVTVFDTAANYGAGHSEVVLGRALATRREEAVIATKFGYAVDEARKEVGGIQISPADIRASCEASLRRLATDRIDLFQLHVGDLPLEQVDGVLESLERLVAEGLIRAYGWSTDDPERARRFGRGAHCVSVQHGLNIFEDAPDMLRLCQETGLASINRGPLGMGLLTGTYARGAAFAPSDIRSRGAAWMKPFQDGQPNPEWLARLEAVRGVLTSGGRTLTQGALAWIWARSPLTVPIPGFRTVAQVRENAGALQFGPLDADQMAEIDRLLSSDGA